MKTIILTGLLAIPIIFGMTVNAQDLHFKEGSVWTVSLIKSNANMSDEYLSQLKTIWISVHDKVLKATGSNTLFLCGVSAVGCVLATWIGAQNLDYKAFMVKNAIISHDSGYTKNVEQMFEADLVLLDINGRDLLKY